jgi:hypothetical protein
VGSIVVRLSEASTSYRVFSQSEALGAAVLLWWDRILI